MRHSTLDLALATISTISQAIRQRHLSPVELVTATLARIDALQPRLQCFTTVTPEYALQRAREAEQEIGHGRYRGPLHGIPYTLKDVVATQGIRTTFGDPKGVDYRPRGRPFYSRATCCLAGVARHRGAGAGQSFAEYLHAQQTRALICQELTAVLRQVDVIAMPTGSTFGDTWDADTVVIRGRQAPARSRAVYRNAMASLSGHPEVSVPCGFGLGDTFPIGLMLHGRPLQEALLYRVAYAYEQATTWHTRHPLL